MKNSMELLQNKNEQILDSCIITDIEKVHKTLICAQGAEEEIFSEIIKNNKEGNEECGSIDQLTEFERKEILLCGDNHFGNNLGGGWEVPSEIQGYMKKARDNFKKSLARGIDTKYEEPLQGLAGYNFLKLIGMNKLSEKFYWAQYFERYIIQDPYRSNPYNPHKYDIRNYLADLERKENFQEADKYLLSLLQNEKYFGLTGYLLAGRSMFTENFQKKEYGTYLKTSKETEKNRLEKFQQNNLTKLKPDTYNRTIEKIELSSFGALDHLLGGVTVGETRGTLGQAIGLKIQINYLGDISKPEKMGPRQATFVTLHELIHTISAGVPGVPMSGLKVENYSTLLNEGMTEFLTQTGINILRKERDFDYNNKISRGYAASTHILTEMFADYQEEFAQLYKAYFGEIDKPEILKRALLTYNSLLKKDPEIIKRIGEYRYNRRD